MGDIFATRPDTTSVSNSCSDTFLGHLRWTICPKFCRISGAEQYSCSTTAAEEKESLSDAASTPFTVSFKRTGYTCYFFRKPWFIFKPHLVHIKMMYKDCSQRALISDSLCVRRRVQQTVPRLMSVDPATLNPDPQNALWRLTQARIDDHIGVHSTLTINDPKNRAVQQLNMKHVIMCDVSLDASFHCPAAEQQRDDSRSD